MDYEFIQYETDGNGITTITMNRPPVNAFNAKMRGELVHALKSFGDARDERIAILTGAGKLFSAGEDLRNVPLNGNDMRDDMAMAGYAEETLSQYHNMIRLILLTGKPIIAVLNGVAAGAGMSIALACDYRIAKDQHSFVTAFESMGLVPDSGMMLTLPRLKDESTLFMFPITPDALVESLTRTSNLTYSFSKEIRTRALLRELNEHVFPWEIRAQTYCLQSEFFKQKASEFLARRSK